MGRKTKTKLNIDELYKYPIAKSNDFAINAVFDLTSLEQKIINYICTKVKKPTVNEEKKIIYNLDYKIDFDEFCKMSGMHINGSSYKRIRAALESLMKKIIDIRMPNNEITGIHILDRYAYAEHQGYANVRIDDRMIPFIIAFEKNFLKYDSRYGMLYKSKYSTRLLEYLKAQLDKKRSGKVSALRKKYKVYDSADIAKLKEDDKQAYFSINYRIINDLYRITINLDLLKNKLFVSKNIGGYQMFYKKILEKVIEELNNLSDIHINKVEYDEKTNDIIFEIRSKNANELQNTGFLIDKCVNDTYLGIKDNNKNEDIDLSSVVYQTEDNYDIETLDVIDDQFNDDE